MKTSPLVSELERLLKDCRVPALAAAAAIGGELCEVAAVGKRRIGSDEQVAETDKWHVGSCTKPMTATLAGILIDKGVMNWDTQVGVAFSSWKADIHEGWRCVTLEQLLSHHGGAPHDIPADLWSRTWQANTLPPTEQRMAFVREVLSQPPAVVPRSKYLYSNTGYAIAGLMIETCTDSAWEKLLGEEVFEPLGMSSAGFGTPGEPGRVDHPYGHTLIKRKLVPVEPGPAGDNPAAIGPGATVHCSIEHLLHFAASHAGTKQLVSTEVMERLHRRYGASEYSSGWFVVERDWGKGYVLSHDGSNTYWYASVWIAPLRNVAFVAASNAPAQAGQRACWEAINGMIRRLLNESMRV